MKRKTMKWIKRHMYGMSIIVLIFIIIVSLCVIFRENISNGFNDISAKVKEVKEEKEAEEKEKQKMTEEKAKKIAVDKFKELGEQNIQEADLQLHTIERNGEEYYFIVSKNNTLEIMISSGEIKRINSIVVE